MIRHTLIAICPLLVASCLLADEVKTRRERIIGGTISAPGARPWQAQLYTAEYPHLCGGSLVAADWVITAAHCVRGSEPDDLTVVLGEHDRTVAEGPEQARGVSAIVLHPDAGDGSVSSPSDVALLRLDVPATFTAYVAPIALMTSDVAPDTAAVVSGWGMSRDTLVLEILHEAPLTVRPNTDCDAAPYLSRDLFDAELCAGDLEAEHGACHGDSGGPLVVNVDGQWRLAGIVSWGQNIWCGTYTVFARVATVAEWVQSYIEPPPPQPEPPPSGTCPGR